MYLNKGVQVMCPIILECHKIIPQIILEDLVAYLFHQHSSEWHYM